MGIGEELDAIRCRAEEDGVSVVVDLHGKLVGLEFRSLDGRPEEIAAVVRRLVGRAAEEAVAVGAAVVARRCGQDVLDALG